MVDREGEKLPVAFFSRQLRGNQCRYSAQELECLAVVESVKHSRITCTAGGSS